MSWFAVLGLQLPPPVNLRMFVLRACRLVIFPFKLRIYTQCTCEYLSSLQHVALLFSHLKCVFPSKYVHIAVLISFIKCIYLECTCKCLPAIKCVALFSLCLCLSVVQLRMKVLLKRVSFKCYLYALYPKEDNLPKNLCIFLWSRHSSC